MCLAPPSFFSFLNRLAFLSLILPPRPLLLNPSQSTTLLQWKSPDVDGASRGVPCSRRRGRGCLLVIAERRDQSTDTFAFAGRGALSRIRSWGEPGARAQSTHACPPLPSTHSLTHSLTNTPLPPQPTTGFRRTGSFSCLRFEQILYNAASSRRGGGQCTRPPRKGKCLSSSKAAPARLVFNVPSKAWWGLGDTARAEGKGREPW